MWFPLLTAVACLLVPQDDAVRFGASIAAGELEVGQSGEIRVAVDWPASLSASGAGLPAPILQLQVPDCVRLTEQHLTEYRDLARNEFLEQPYERLLQENAATIPFELIAEPAEGDTIGLVLIAYVSGPDGSAKRFVRERIELPVRGGAKSRDGDDADSHWGPADARLQIGDEATPVTLPRADGTELALGDLLGKQNLVVTTYRAHW